ncbi:hypothetical protein E8L90_14610 [Brevibacillus antibioticus]|uniref:Uncharacterized protein n=1 Tax=Brevibacillus antibioticus TaxID=2570228 RepID=A0A4U2Y7Q6_9BACL|nr:hypothetical protein [Brevibacillus antibioticus]TKI56599.1 hypothetical protein E8L90_14610 [Brevibacillus antibioticus]
MNSRCSQLPYTFDDLRNDVIMGREIHFLYEGKEYSISHSSRGSHLCEFYQDDYTFSTREELLTNGTIAGKNVRDIWPHVEVTAIF